MHKDEGVIGMYGVTTKEGEQIIYVSLRKGDDGVPIESLLPKDMQGEHFAKAPIRAYFRAAQYWLCDTSNMEKLVAQAQKSQPPNPEGKVTIEPPLNLRKLDLILPDGTIDKERMIRLFQIVGKCWKYPLRMGLICKLAQEKWSLDEVEETTMAIAESVDTDLPDISHDLIYNMLMPPDCRSGKRLIRKHEIDHVLRWYCRPGGDDTFQGMLFNRQGFMELGLLQKGVLNTTICQRASEYVWSNQDEKPDFFKLKEYLSQFKTTLPRQPKKKLSKSVLQKLKKRKRKHGCMK